MSKFSKTDMMTIREAAAIEIMAAIVSVNPSCAGMATNEVVSRMARFAVRCADAVLHEAED